MEEIKNEELAQDVASEHSGLSQTLNKYFHHIDKGSKLKTEITAGIFLGIMSVCAMFMNIQLLSSYTLTSTTSVNGEAIAALWFMTMLIAFVASVAMGVIARLPFAQISGLGLSTVMISIVGGQTGLTYYNVLAICLVSSIIYTAIVAIPKVREIIYNAIPQGVKKAIPVAIGVLIALIAIRLSGLVTFDSSTGSIVTYSSLSTKAVRYVYICAIVCVLCVLFFKSRKDKHPYLWSLLISTVLYLVLVICFISMNWTQMNMSYDALWARLWMVGSEDSMIYHIMNWFKGYNFTALFSEGFNFSGYEGSVVLLFITGALSMTLSFMFYADATIDTCEIDEKSSKLAYICNGVANVIAPIIGVAPVAISTENVAANEEGAKSGITAIVASIVFLLSAFVWAIPALFASTTSSAISFNQYGHYGVVLEMLTDSSFAFVDVIMVFVGGNIALKALKKVEWTNYEEGLLVVATLLVTIFTSNIAIAVCLAITLVTLKKVLTIKIETIKAIKVTEWIVFAIALVLLILTIL